VTLYCFTVGYQGRSLEDLCSLLIDMGVTLLVDIRERAWSQRPEFRKNALRRGLESVGIEYIHLKQAGNPFRPRGKESMDFIECAGKYRGYLQEHQMVVSEALELVKASEAAFFCYEADSNECHRSVLVEEIQRVFPSLGVEHL